MKITITARHFDASEKLQAFVNDEIRELKKYFDGVLHAEVVLDEHAALKEVEIRINMLGKVLTSKVEGDDFYKIVPKVIDKLETQIKTAKAKAFQR